MKIEEVEIEANIVKNIKEVEGKFEREKKA